MTAWENLCDTIETLCDARQLKGEKRADVARQLMEIALGVADNRTVGCIRKLFDNPTTLLKFKEKSKVRGNNHVLCIPHYHIYVGLRGCIPSVNAIVFHARDVKEALSDLLSELWQSNTRYYAEYVERDKRGNIIEGLWTAQSGLDYFQVTQCDDYLCIEQEALDNGYNNVEEWLKDCPFL